MSVRREYVDDICRSYFVLFQTYSEDLSVMIIMVKRSQITILVISHNWTTRYWEIP